MQRAIHSLSQSLGFLRTGYHCHQFLAAHDVICQFKQVRWEYCIFPCGFRLLMRKCPHSIQRAWIANPLSVPLKWHFLKEAFPFPPQPVSGDSPLCFWHKVLTLLIKQSGNRLPISCRGAGSSRAPGMGDAFSKECVIWIPTYIPNYAKSWECKGT